jgi:hypothetical protein
MNPPQLARWNGSAWEPLDVSPECLKIVDLILGLPGSRNSVVNGQPPPVPHKPGRPAEPVCVEEVDDAAYASWCEKHPGAKPVDLSTVWSSGAEGSAHLGYASANYLACRLAGKRSVKLGCGVTVCYVKHSRFD